jgi:hypothetical protein
VPWPVTLGWSLYWEGFYEYFRSQGLAIISVLFSNYERLGDSLIADVVDVAWEYQYRICERRG